METIHVVGYPRSGTVWLTRLLSCALDSPITTLANPSSEYQKAIMETRPIAYSEWDTLHTDFCETGNGGYRIVKTHWMAYQWNGEGKVVFIQRDPRDVAVSAAHYLNIPLWDVLRNMCIESSVPFDKSRHIFHVQGAYLKFMEGWIFAESIYTWYENLKVVCAEELVRIAKKLNAEIALGQARVACEKTSFDNLKAKYPHSMRKGIVGDWKNHFDQKHGEMITKHLGSFMLQQGYVEDLDWWQQLKS